MKKIFYFMVIIAISMMGCASGGSEMPTTPGIDTEIHDGADHDEADHIGAELDETDSEATDGEDHSHEGEIEFTAEQKSRIDFAVEKVGVGPFGQVIKTVGQLLPVPGGEQVLVAPTSGLLSFQGTAVVEGAQAAANRPLFYISGGNMADNNIGIRYLEAENEYLKAKAEYERKEALANDQIVSSSELTAAKTEFLNAEAVYNNLKNSFSSGRYSVAPNINGYIQHINVSSGQHVDAGEPLATVVADNQLYVRAEVRQSQASKLSEISSASFKTNDGTTYSLDDLNGKLVAYGRGADPEHPLLPATFLIDNPGTLVPGTFVDTYIVTGEKHDAITVPNGSIVEEMGAYFVFVELHEDMYGKIPVTPGGTDGFRTEILSGLTGEEIVVSKGAIFVKLAQGAGTLDAHAGHVH